jgi:serine/threonine-protein kinase
VQIYSAEAPNIVLAQNPKAGAHVITGSTIRINVSRGLKPISVPNVVGDPYPNAVSALTGAGFAITRTDIDSQAPKGQVVAQEPLAGAKAPNGSKITLSVSKGPAISQVPDVTGQNQADATALLKGAGYRATVQQQPVTDPSQDGLVISQNPIGGTQARKGAVVTLAVGQLTAPTTTAETTTATTTTAATTTTTTPPTP